MVASLIILVPVIELMAAAWPFEIGRASWRLTVIGTAAGVVGMPILGLFLLLTLAAMSGQRGAPWLISSACILGGVLCLVGSGVFALDAIQMRAQVRVAAASRYSIATAWTVVKLCLSSGTLLVLGASSYRTANTIRRRLTTRDGKNGSLSIHSSAAPPERTAG
jgi:hypothetical protein